MMNKIIVFTMLLAFLSCQEKSKNESRVDRLPFYNEETFTPHWFANDNEMSNSFHKISPFSFQNQDGEVLTQETFVGKIYVTDFFFTSCGGICPKMTSNMKLLQDEFIDDDKILLLSHSVTPDRDSVSVLKAYAKTQEIISGKWHLVTGSKEEIYKLGRKDYFVEEDLGVDKDNDDFLHTENFVLIDKNSHIRGIYNGLNKTSVNQLIIDIHTLKKK